MFGMGLGVRRFFVRAPVMGGIMAGIGALVIAALPDAFTHEVHERVVDMLLTRAAAQKSGQTQRAPVMIVDIDTRSLASIGPWPWPRGRIAKLVEAAHEAGASAVAIDILFAGEDTISPAALARRLGRLTVRPDLTTWADTLEDGDPRLAAALAASPAALGFAMSPDDTAAVPGVPFLTTGPVAMSGIWRMAGAVTPPMDLARAASGLGVLALPGDEDGLVRRVPLLAGVAGAVVPGLVTEAVRLAQGASAYRLDGVTGTIAIGGLLVPMPPDGMLRLVPGRIADIVSVPAADILMGSGFGRRLEGTIVLIGGSAPELGGLRPAPGDPLTPAAVLHAMAISQLVGGIVPRPPPHAGSIGVASILGAVALGLLAATRLRPARGVCALAGILLLLGAAALAEAMSDRIFDPTVPAVLAVVAFASCTLVIAAETQLREARIRQRFAQHLAPAVVARIAANPSILKLAGEHREITAMFTDVEGFTSMTHRAGPETLVALLDSYFEGVTRIIIDHGGMIDKLVGDAVHAFFNMPLDLPDHPERAVTCAMVIQVWTEAYRREAQPARFLFGRTRIGIETGGAIVGDVGIGAKLDYTAHGDTVNAAARFEAANKEIGSAICVGPQAAARCSERKLRPTGTIRLRGFDDAVRTYEPWPADADADWRDRYLGALSVADHDPAAAADVLSGLSAERPDDPVPGILASRLRAVSLIAATTGVTL